MNKARYIAGNLLLAATLTLLPAGCSRPGNSTSGFANLPTEGWRYGTYLDFTLKHPDSIAEGLLVTAFRHNSAYPYTTLVYEITASGKTDTINLSLADRYGKWRGCGIGVSYQITDTIGKIQHISGEPIKIRHLMRCDTLPGISQAGVFLIAEP